MKEQFEKAMTALSENCGELSALRRRGNFMPGTLARIDDADDDICHRLATIREYVDMLEGENDLLRERHAASSGKAVSADEAEAHAPGPIDELSEKSGVCSGELCDEDPEILIARMKQHGVTFTPESIASNAEHIASVKEHGGECKVCKHQENAE